MHSTLLARQASQCLFANNLAGAVPATPSPYMAMCLHSHIPPDIDAIIVEYNVNDGTAKGNVPERRAHERLLRKLLKLPRAPLVMEMVVHRWLLFEDEQKADTPYRYFADGA